MAFVPHPRRTVSLSSFACCAALTLAAACSDDSGPIPPVVGSSGAAGAGGAAEAGGAAGSGMAGASMAGQAGSGGVAGGAGAVAVIPFDDVVLFPFDFGTPGTYGWATDAGGGTVSIVNEDRDPANATPGALRYTATFVPYDTFGASLPVSVFHAFGDPNTATNKMLAGATRVHMWIRLSAPTGVPGSLAFFQPFVQGGAATGYSSNYGYALPAVLADNLWHEFVLEVAGTAYMSDVWRFGVQLSPATRPVVVSDAGAPGPVLDAGDAGDAGASDAPAPLTIDIDYLWLE